MEATDIRYLQRDRIDIKEWDKCIERAENGLLYASSKYLDILSNGLWNALVSGDYDCVMPLPFKRKYGINRTFKVMSDLVLMVFMRKYLQKPMHLFGTIGFISFGIGLLINL